MPIVSGAMALALVCVLAPSIYTLVAISGFAPMTVPIFLGWLAWLQVIHIAGAAVIWKRRARVSTRMKAALLSWGGLAFWYWLPAPIYFLLTMNLDQLQLQWTALAFFWEVPVVGGAFVLAAQRLYPSRRRLSNDPARRYRAVMRYPTVVGSLLFAFTLLGYTIGALQLRLFAALPLIEQIKNVGHGVVISLLLAVFYHLGLDRVLEPVRSRIAREGGLGTIVARTVAGRIFGVSLAVAVSGFALITLFVLQAFQAMVADSAATAVTRDLARLARTAETGRDLGAYPAWGEHGRLLLLRPGATLPAGEFSPETRARVERGGEGVVHDTRGDLKVVAFVPAPRLGGTLVGVAFHTDAYGALRAAARLLALAGAFVLTVTVGMLVFASRASTQAVRALSSAVRRVEAGQVDDTILRVDTGDEIGELSAVVERYVRRSRDLSENLQDKVREKTQELSAKLEEIERADARLQAVVQHLPEGVLLLEADGRVAITNAFGRTHLPAVAALGAAGEVTAVGGLPLAHLLAAHVEPREVAGGERLFQVAAQPLDLARGAVLVIRDVTREREAQQVVQRQARLAAVGQLAAGIAHDFNNILMTIVNSAELAQRKYDDTAFVHARLRIVVEQGERAAALVRQILDFSRQSEPALETVNLTALLAQTVALLERTLPETIAIVLEPSDGDFIVAADPNQLSQVMTNLAVNARDAMALGGELRFRLGREMRASSEGEAAAGPGAWVTLTVTDTGPGMPPQVRERIFEPFFTTKAPGSGTGLGLSQAYGIITQHRGHIAVDSRPGEGTTFTVSLPDEGAATLAVVGVAGSEIVSGRGETLLVVEDEAPVRQALAHILTDLNYEVLAATCAEQALELHEAHAGAVALVLTDLVMPGMGGLRLVRELRERGAHVPVIMMSGYVDESSRGSVAGVTAWIQKPLRARRLGAVIHEALAPRVS
jgi:signal transduction histidine kinase/HAMP domain-containing protein